MSQGRRVESEEALIQRYLAPLAAPFPGALGLGDDAAFLSPPADEDMVLTMDAVAAGVHFLADDAPDDIAWKALAVNVSDLVAKGARPFVYLMSLAFPEAPEESWLERFAAGLAAAQARFGIALAGGDTDRRPAAPLSITITAIGTLPRGSITRRGSARAGDRLFVSGTLGDAALGLELRRAPALADAWGLGADASRALVARYQRPNPPLALAPAIRAFASAAMDISDGLAKDLGRLAKASGVRAVVRGAKLPLSAAASRVLAAAPERLGAIVAGGDDYEALVAVAPADCEAFSKSAAEAGVEVTEIGVLEEGEDLAIEDASGHPLSLDKPGWEHF